MQENFMKLLRGKLRAAFIILGLLADNQYGFKEGSCKIDAIIQITRADGQACKSIHKIRNVCWSL